MILVAGRSAFALAPFGHTTDDRVGARHMGNGDRLYAGPTYFVLAALATAWVAALTDVLVLC
jgi:hypothetical protein